MLPEPESMTELVLADTYENENDRFFDDEAEVLGKRLERYQPRQLKKKGGGGNKKKKPKTDKAKSSGGGASSSVSECKNPIGICVGKETAIVLIIISVMICLAGLRKAYQMMFGFKAPIGPDFATEKKRGEDLQQLETDRREEWRAKKEIRSGGLADSSALIFPDIIEIIPQIQNDTEIKCQRSQLIPEQQQSVAADQHQDNTIYND